VRFERLWHHPRVAEDIHQLRKQLQSKSSGSFLLFRERRAIVIILRIPGRLAIVPVLARQQFNRGSVLLRWGNSRIAERGAMRPLSRRPVWPDC
jgi:hypothetical protein